MMLLSKTFEDIDLFKLILRFEYYVFIFFFIIFFITWVKRKYAKANLFFIIILFFYRIPFLYIYHKFITGDWIAYVNWARTWDLSKPPTKLGGDFVPYLLKYYVMLDMTEIDMFWGFSILSYIATVIVYLTIHKLTNYTDKVKLFGTINIFPWVLLYPSLHMYTQMVGKDAVIYFGTSLVLYSLLGKRFNLTLTLIGIFIALLVRPHMGVILIVSYGLTLMVSDKVKPLVKGILLVTGIGGFVALLPIILKLFTLSSFSLSYISATLSARSDYVNFATTYVDTSSYPLPLKMYTYLFRPMPYEFGIPLLIEYSFENLFFFIIFLSIFNWKFWGWLKRQPHVIKFCFIHWLIGTMILCNGLPVYGLFIRQKTMVFPLMLTFLFAFIYYKNQIKGLN